MEMSSKMELFVMEMSSKMELFVMEMSSKMELFVMEMSSKMELFVMEMSSTKMELFLKIVEDFQALTILAKFELFSIIEILQGSEYSSVNGRKTI